jgi:hypothetical protein
MPPFMLPRDHVDLLVAVAFGGPRHERGGRTGRWQRPTWLAQPRTSPDDIGWLLVHANFAALFAHYPLANWTEMPGVAPDWTCHPGRKLVYEFRDPGYRLSAVEAIKALATFEAVAACVPQHAASHAGQFCTSLREALLRVVPGMELAPAVWYTSRLRLASADAEDTPTPVAA